MIFAYPAMRKAPMSSSSNYKPTKSKLYSKRYWAESVGKLLGKGRERRRMSSAYVIRNAEWKYSRVSFYDGSFYDDSLLRPSSSRTEHSRLVVHHCRKSSALSLLSALQALFRRACVCFFFFYFSALLLILIFPPMTPIKETEFLFYFFAKRSENNNK